MIGMSPYPALVSSATASAALIRESSKTASVGDNRSAASEIESIDGAEAQV